jgi:hypothetical protein
MHLVATNLALWVRTIIWESANEWIHHMYQSKRHQNQLTGNDGVTPIGPVALGLRSGFVDLWKSAFPQHEIVCRYFGQNFTSTDDFVLRECRLKLK